MKAIRDILLASKEAGMRIGLLNLSLLGMLLVSAVAQATAQVYYLALGDSLAIGIQPSLKGDVPTNQGYADDLYKAFRPAIPGLTLVKLGCSGETTTSMMDGTVCNYPEGSQLNAAVSFLETHQVAFVTIDIGANDIDQCINPKTGAIDGECAFQAGITVGTKLPQILAALRAAAPNTHIVGMNYYDPLLAAWVLATNGQSLAQVSEVDTVAFNTVLETSYQALSVPVADVAGAFHMTDFKKIPFINLPVNVFVTLTSTWMAAPAPIGPDVHPNALGYATIAIAFGEKIAHP
jgi:lysophospholipase L1-like esterase